MIDQRLQVLRVLAARGTVTATAQALKYTPSAVSHQLKSLAADLGVELLEPQGRGVRLTRAGRLLLAQADDLFARWEEMEAELARLRTGTRPRLRLAGFSTAASTLLPGAAAAVGRLFPETGFRIIEADPEECFELLITQEADVAVVVATDPLPVRNDPRFEQADLFNDPLDLLVPQDHRLAEESSVLLSAAAEEPWILDRPGTTYSRLVHTACAQAGFVPRFAHQCREWETGAALVAAGFGVALVPRLARLPAGHRVTRVPLRGEPAPDRRVLTGIRRGSRNHPLIAAALQALDEGAAGLDLGSVG